MRKKRPALLYSIPHTGNNTLLEVLRTHYPKQELYIQHVVPFPMPCRKVGMHRPYRLDGPETEGPYLIVPTRHPHSVLFSWWKRYAEWHDLGPNALAHWLAFHHKLQQEILKAYDWQYFRVDAEPEALGIALRDLESTLGIDGLPDTLPVENHFGNGPKSLPDFDQGILQCMREDWGYT